MDLGATMGYSISPDANEQLLNISFHPGLLIKSITREELVGMVGRVKRLKRLRISGQNLKFSDTLPLHLAIGIVTH